MRVNSTCRLRTAEKGTLAGSNLEDYKSKLPYTGCKEQSDNDEL
jgi:hypothetical protein